MRKFFAACCFVASFTGLQASNVLYATGSQGLYTVNPQSGAASLLWNFASQGFFLHNGGLVYDPVADRLLANGYDQSSRSALFSINRFTGAISMIGYASADSNLQVQSLARDPLSGNLFASSMYGFQSSTLFSIDRNTGAASIIGQATGQFTALYGLGFRADGVLFGNGFVDYANSPGSDLLTVNPATGGTAHIGKHGLFAGGMMAYSGIAFADDGTMLGLGSIDSANTGLFRINPVSGAATLIGPNLTSIGAGGGLAFAPVPEPASWAALASSLLLYNGRRRGRRAK